MIGWFFDQVRVIVACENHHFKFDGKQQILDILHASRFKECISVDFSEECGQWFIDEVEASSYLGITIRRATTPADVLNLPLVAKRFSRTYRFEAKRYANGDNQSLEVLPHGRDET
jgi:hypothetical protein